MVRNWQSRVEIASARRSISKQKKVKVDNKRQWKLYIQEFQSTIDRIMKDPKLIKRAIAVPITDGSSSSCGNEKERTVWKLHIWTDTIPQSQSASASSPPLPINDKGDDDDDDDDNVDDDHSSPDDDDDNHADGINSTNLGAKGKKSPDIVEDLRKRMRSKSLGYYGDDDHHQNDDDDAADMKLGVGPNIASPKGRARSNSTTVATAASYNNSGNQKKMMKKKKIHPRSSSNYNNNIGGTSKNVDSDIGEIGPMSMCRSYFYTGSCDYVNISSPRLSAGRKGSSNNIGVSSVTAIAGSSGGCRHCHGCYSSRTDGTIELNQSSLLYNVVTTSSGNMKRTARSTLTSNKEELQRSNSAEFDYYQNVGSSEFTVRDVGAMDMLYYIEVNFEFPVSSQDAVGSDIETKQPSEIISEAITNLQLYLATITYIAINSVFVYDRYRNGSLYNTDQDLITALLSPLAISSGGETDDNNNNDNTQQQQLILSQGNPLTWNHIPDTILVHILMYLPPDNSIAAMSLVCKHWHHEIQSNPVIWRNMLDNGSWPQPKISPPYVMVSPSSSYHPTARDTFCQHYSVQRDMAALRSGLDALLDSRSAAIAPSSSSKEMTYRKFATTTKKHHSPTQPTNCIAIRDWSPNRTLVAYDRDCTLRLFGTQPGDNNNASALCKEIICQKFDPYRNTKKRTCVLLSMDLDEQCITCLGRVTGSTSNPTEAYVLLVMTRDDFLLGDSNDTTAGSCGYSEDISKVTVIDIHEAVFNYMVSLDEVYGGLAYVREYLEDGGSVGAVQITPSDTIASCGHGRFMIEVKILIPNDGYDGMDDDEEYLLVNRRLLLFSSTVGAIIWSHENTRSQEMPTFDPVFLTCFRRPEVCTMAMCYFAVRTLRSERVLVGHIDPSGWITSTDWFTIEQCDRLPCFSGWLLENSLMVLTFTGIVFANSFVNRSGVTTERKVVVSFCGGSTFTEFYRDEEGRCSGILLHILGQVKVLRLSVIRDDYVAMVCRSYGQDEETGQLLPKDYLVIVVHVPTRKEICRTVLRTADEPYCVRDSSFFGDEDEYEDGMLLTSDSAETIGLSLSWEGIVMTGRDIRNVIESTTKTAMSQKQKKKPHLRNNSGYKKDGFRLGKK